MNPILRNILAVIAGLILGNIVNMAIISISETLIPPPKRVDVTTMEGLKNSIHLFEAKHFVMPFLAHAIGTLAGAILTYLIATPFQKFKLVLVISFFFLLGGIVSAFIIPAPIWFIALYIIVAYIPMAFIAKKYSLQSRLYYKVYYSMSSIALCLPLSKPS